MSNDADQRPNNGFQDINPEQSAVADWTIWRWLGVLLFFGGALLGFPIAEALKIPLPEGRGAWLVASVVGALAGVAVAASIVMPILGLWLMIRGRRKLAQSEAAAPSAGSTKTSTGKRADGSDPQG